MKQLKTVDLFAGIGGLSLAFGQAGFTNVYATDNDVECGVTWAKNFADELILKDITRESEANYQGVSDDLDEILCDVLLAGFPCQSFSQAGTQAGFSDPKGRGQLVFQLLGAIKKRRPPVIFFENVSRLSTHRGGRTLLTIVEKLEKIGYHCQWQVLRSDEYGNLPQQRERFYLVGFLDEKQAQRFSWPNKIALTQTLFDLLEPNVDVHYYYEQKPLWAQLSKLDWCDGEIYLWRRNQRRTYHQGICPTLLASMGTGGHNVPLIKDKRGVRKLTPRECARLQGLPDSFVLPTTLAEKTLYQQLGNTVSVSVVQRIAVEIAKVLKNC